MTHTDLTAESADALVEGRPAMHLPDCPCPPAPCALISGPLLSLILDITGGNAITPATDLLACPSVTFEALRQLTEAHPDRAYATAGVFFMDIDRPQPDASQED